MDFDEIPRFAELPIEDGLPAESSWGVFGRDDGIGCLNFLTPAGIVAAAKLVRDGKVFRLDAKLGFADPPLFGRAAMQHTIVPLGPFANDDMLDNLNTQSSSQWDGLGHVGVGLVPLLADLQNLHGSKIEYPGAGCFSSLEKV